ncbi:MAG TPA: hypothetical protein VGR26_15710 [Acidimicrobiales bacterium]|nr:hypothetical protein [Acidimicrobiales bacterium]
MGWLPLSKRNDPDAARDYNALHDGVPEWLATPVAQWVVDVFASMKYDDRLGQRLDFLYGMLRRPMPATRNRIGDSVADLVGAVAAGDLDVLDAVLWMTQATQEGDRLRTRLESLLRVHGSAWSVSAKVAGQPCLVRRVDETVTAAAQVEMDQTGNAARHLYRAWHRIYGRNPDPGGSYRESVRAVEAAAKPLIAPKASRATLGTMLADLRNKPEKWSVALDERGKGTGVDLLIEMCSGLWRSQFDRHGSDDESIPLDVSSREAEAAVHLAVTLVHWFRSGVVARTDQA